MKPFESFRKKLTTSQYVAGGGSRNEKVGFPLKGIHHSSEREMRKESSQHYWYDNFLNWAAPDKLHTTNMHAKKTPCMKIVEDADRDFFRPYTEKLKWWAQDFYLFTRYLP